MIIIFISVTFERNIAIQYYDIFVNTLNIQNIRAVHVYSTYLFISSLGDKYRFTFLKESQVPIPLSIPYHKTEVILCNHKIYTTIWRVFFLLFFLLLLFDSS